MNIDKDADLSAKNTLDILAEMEESLADMLERLNSMQD